jgi:hypothetical protein
MCLSDIGGARQRLSAGAKLTFSEPAQDGLATTYSLWNI